jgi:7,8-dihydroneopterin aldolase/epimerase/oxygenase
MSTTLQLHGLRVPTRIGVWDWEHETPQTLIYDLDLELDSMAAARAATTDALVDTLDYAQLENALEAWALATHYDLLERLAPTLAGWLLAYDARIAGVALTIHKPGALRLAPAVRIHHTAQRTLPLLGD